MRRRRFASPKLFHELIKNHPILNLMKQSRFRIRNSCHRHGILPKHRLARARHTRSTRIHLHRRRGFEYGSRKAQIQSSQKGKKECHQYNRSAALIEHTQKPHDVEIDPLGAARRGPQRGPHPPSDRGGGPKGPRVLKRVFASSHGVGGTVGSCLASLGCSICRPAPRTHHRLFGVPVGDLAISVYRDYFAIRYRPSGLCRK